MIQRRQALARIFWLAMMNISASNAGVWVMNPVVGILGDYSSNPGLLYDAHSTGVTSGALQVDAPIAYQGDALQFAILPSIRQSDSRGYSSVTSNYEHLNLKTEYDTEVSTFSATAGLNRDSSVAFNELISGTTGVRRDASTADMTWDRHFTERLEFGVDANTQRVLFGHNAGVAVGALVDYNYSSVSAGLGWNGSERNKYTLNASVSRYNSLNATEELFVPPVEFIIEPISTESRSAGLQTGFVRQLSELWTLTAQGGYSRALNQIIEEPITLVATGNDFQQIIQVGYRRRPSSQNGSVYSASLTHKGTLLTLNATASRQLAPTGFEFLSRQDTYELNAAYTLSERWSFGGDVRAVRYQNPPLSGEAVGINTRYFTLSASWHWTERWTVSLAASRVSETAQSSPFNAASNEATLTLSRQFDPLTF